MFVYLWIRDEGIEGMGIIDIMTSLNSYMRNIRKMGIKLLFILFLLIVHRLYMSRVSLFNNQERKRGSLEKKSNIASKTARISD